MNPWVDIEFFKVFEFDSPDMPGSGVNMNMAFVRKLDLLRKACGFPLVILSGFRTATHNAEVGGVDGSAHELGHAVDIKAIEAGKRFRILQEAFKLGFRRVGQGSGFIHIDDDITKPQDVCWTYPSTAKRGTT